MGKIINIYNKIEKIVLIEHNGAKVKIRKAKEFYNMWFKWCKTFDKIYYRELNK